MLIDLIFYSIVVAIVSFDQSTYNVNESVRQLQPVLVLSNPSSTDISITITVSLGNATGESTSIVSIGNYNFVQGVWIIILNRLSHLLLE